MMLAVAEQRYSGNLILLGNKSKAQGINA